MAVNDLTVEEFIDAIDFEGGVVYALRYGLHEDRLIDSAKAEPLYEQWRLARKAYAELEPHITAIESLVFPDVA